VAAGRRQSERLVPVLAAYDLRRLVSSSSDRCVETLAPYADQAGLELERLPELSEEDATKAVVRRTVSGLVGDLLATPRRDGGLVVCTHRPVLPWVFDAIGTEDPGLEKGELCVLHLRGSKVVAAERHQAG
jgi:8-oxo-dGTP diphosphatase